MNTEKEKSIRNLEELEHIEDTFPNLPDEMRQFLRMAEMDAHLSPQATKLLDENPWLRDSFLWIANCPLFKFTHQFEDINQALVFFGSDKTKKLILNNLLLKVFQSKNSEILPFLESLKEQSVQTAFTSYFLAKHKALPFYQQVLAFHAGLHHAVGKMYLLNRTGSNYISLLKHAKQKKTAISELENRYLNLNHVNMAEALLEHWGAPKETKEVISLYNGPFNENSLNQAAACVHAASLLVEYPKEFENQQLKNLVNPTVETWLDLSKDEIISIRNNLGGEKQAIQEYIDIIK